MVPGEFRIIIINIVAVEVGGAVVGGDEQIEVAVAIEICVSKATPDFGTAKSVAEFRKLRHETYPCHHLETIVAAGRSRRCGHCARYRRCGR